MTDPAPRPTFLGLDRGEKIRLLVMSGFLAALIGAWLFTDTQRTIERIGEVPVDHIVAEPPDLDETVLAKIDDSSRRARIEIEEAPLRHLLEKSLNVVPAVARALGMPSTPTPVATLRAQPDRWRGRYVFFEGSLEYLSPARSGHPVRGFKIHEARLRTEDGEPIVFFFSVPPKEEVQVGNFVRAEGFFMKLRDGHFPELNEAPVLVGPELFPAHKRMEPVTELDPTVLAKIKDGRLGLDGMLIEREDVMLRLVDSQDLPLWHMASHAQHREATLTRDELWAVPAFVESKQWEDVMLGRVPKGTPMRLLGTFILATTFPAKLNPAGIEHWTELLIQVRDLGGRVLQVWIPGEIGDHWRRGNAVVVHGLFFKRLVYETQEGREHATAVFVADTVHPFTLVPNESNRVIGWVLAGIVLVLIAFVFWNHRREIRARAQHEETLLERRRRRRGVSDPRNTLPEST